MLEEWKDIHGYEGFYQVSSYGRIYSLRTFTYLKPLISYDYCYVNLSIKGKRKRLSIHRLVAEHFIPNILNKKEVNHIDGNKRNNHYYNLEWSTRKENACHASQVLNMRKKKVMCIENNEIFNSLKDASYKYKISSSDLSNCLAGRTKTYAGFHWKYC